jgi:sulfate adenylyltransferase subunit 2
MDVHLAALEAEAIAILREARARFGRPVLLYSIGKDSCVLHHLARKAFAPAPLDIPLLHVDTRFKFRAMIAFRDSVAARSDVRMVVAINEAALASGLAPTTAGPDHWTRIMKTEQLRTALDQYGFDCAIGGARRDEERSRAKEHVFSLRSRGHIWDPRGQRPELFGLYNTDIDDGETMRCFPLSNWTELDVWRYVASQGIDVVPLYFAAPRSVVRRSGQWIMVDDDRLPIRAGEQVETRVVRFRTLGCYPFTAAHESNAATVDDIIDELRTVRSSERMGRVIDHVGGSMEDKKRDGYF